jgi:ribonuclease D
MRLYPEGDVLCTMLASRILTNGLPNLKHGLQHVVKRYLKLEISKEEQKSDWTGDLTHNQLDYAAYDVELLTQLDGPINQRMAEGNLHKAWFLECKALPTMAQLWRTGMPFERLALEELSRELTEDHKKLREALSTILTRLCLWKRNWLGKTKRYMKRHAGVLTTVLLETLSDWNGYATKLLKWDTTTRTTSVGMPR